MKVLKFGGTSVGSAKNIQQVASILSDYQQNGQRVAVVVSAMSGITNKLIEVGERAASGDETYKSLLKDIESTHLTCIRELIEVRRQSKTIAFVKLLLNDLEDILRGIFLLKELSLRSLDILQSFGERLSSFIIAEYLTQIGVEAEQLDARKIVRTNAVFGGAKVDFVTTNSAITKHFGETDKMQIVTGFIASSESGETTTLGRGGSDYSAAIFGAALNVKEIEIWTDVDGVMTTDPRVVPTAFSLQQLSYEEAMEMSHFGAKVIYPPTLQPAIKKNIPLRIRNTFNPSFPGTLVTSTSGQEDWPVKGISSIKDISLITLSGSGLIGVPGVSSRLFGALARGGVSMILITQASSEHTITFAVAPDDAAASKKIIEEEFFNEMASGKVNPVEVENSLSILAIIGENMKERPGVAAKLFSALGKNGVNIAAIAQGSSELNVSVVIEKKHLNKSLNALHEIFFLSDMAELNVFMLGLGLIGGTLLNQMRDQAEYLLTERNLRLNVVGAANSKKMIFSDTGLDISLEKEAILADGEESNAALFVEKMIEMNLPNSVFVDCTPGESAVKLYEKILMNSISITTPNKIANSSSLDYYLKCQAAAKRRGVKFLYETNVGAGLPVIGPLQDLGRSGDKIIKIEGILSGTLSYLFNTFAAGMKFSDLVKQAKEMGYTEPDPRDDLGGVDVARKILILAREAGYNLEPSDVTVEPILPQACLDAPSVDDFFVELEKANGLFEEKRAEAELDGKALRIVATLDEEGKATVALRAVDSTHPFYGLVGSDNMVVFKSRRYFNEPLVIRGPGAGAEVTAAGVFAEIITIGNFLIN
ncbi:bifunctional aspartate kinase/homoserine dehydrogenase I [Flammeovirga yaeyamensis]|uniref:Bifunctional aspartate kinase/homoserine dehydrogenase I n=1 Tax=Flammeovirga yaeyamensis TaxID=367791 RepID=A0AAX1N7P6_9BACT|nr:bifunctional aspartate kinase/homoserine dehydrogenase I [Flammeovirga yaeyamensis]MBB3701014.1 aspartokinase/homoserine dehydrogenase 1 [Flammeovirga yaeyamensis]NMF38152.1 bifunctional aspartate kinase/homoserine dehydrogenase I [Flammeovirga yaeyamensis]QWG01923.1 bifunctional aspartate kinase/homoserine dehydrogenase I [Flammeovirga yaeyamensis]